MRWHHAREEFAAKETLGRLPDVKGAIVHSNVAEPTWCIWTRTFGSTEEGNTLHILRLVGEGEDMPDMIIKEGEARTRIKAVASVLQAAQKEAAKWGRTNVQIWNPSTLVTLAAKELLPSAKVVDRDEDSITSLMWYGPGSGTADEVDWLGNERYGWC